MLPTVLGVMLFLFSVTYLMPGDPVSVLLGPRATPDLIALVKERLPGKAKYMVLKYLKMGVIELGQIINADMLALARLYLRARRLRDEIWQLEQASGARMRKRLERFLDC